MLVAKGFAVSFKMASGGRVRAPGRSALLHDESGRDWPKCSALVMPIHTSREDEEVSDRAASSYFGTTALGGSAQLPPRNPSAWKARGLIDEILYTRRRPYRLSGQLQDEYFHSFEGDARLYQRGELFRVELGSGCQWNWRGIVRP